MKQKIKNTIIFRVILGMKFFAGLLTHRLALTIGGLLGGLFHDLVPKERKRALAGLATAFPEWTQQQRDDMTRKVFVSVGKSAFELFKMFSMPTRKIMGLVEAVEGKENMEAALARKKGVCCLTAHMDNWEILVIYTHNAGWPSAAVAQALYDPRLDILLNAHREKHGITVIKRKSVTKDIIRCLRNNMLLGMLNDQDTSVDSVWAPFFGKAAKTPVGIFRLARKVDAAVVPVFIIRQPSGKHKIIIKPALDLDAGGDEQSYLDKGARLCNREIESIIRRYPEQWVWFHQRWKNRPPDELKEKV